MGVAHTSSNDVRSSAAYPTAFSAFAACRMVFAWAHWLTCMDIDWCAWCAAGAQCCVHCKQRSRNLERALLVRRLETQPYLQWVNTGISTRFRIRSRRVPVGSAFRNGEGSIGCGLGKPYSSSHSLDHYILVRVNGHCALLLQRGRHHHRMPFALQMDTPAQHGACMNIVKGQHEVTATRS